VILSGDCVNVVIGFFCGNGVMIVGGDCVNFVTWKFVWKRDCDDLELLCCGLSLGS
jgi:hypothetical protein